MSRHSGEKAPVGERAVGPIKEPRLSQAKGASATPRVKITNKSTEGEVNPRDNTLNSKQPSVAKPLKDGESSISSSTSSSTAASIASSSTTPPSESSDKRASDNHDHDDGSCIRKRIPFDKLVKQRVLRAEAELDVSARAMSPGILGSSLRVASPSAANKAKQSEPKQPKVYTSHLDFVPSSSLQKSEFWGFFSLLTIFASGYLTQTLYLNKISTGYFIDTQLLHTLTEGLNTVALIIGAMILYSWGAFVLQLLVTKGMGGYRLVADGLPAVILQHSMQSGLFVMGIVEVSKRGWPVVQTGFLVLEMLVLFMKMHSYTMVNRDLDLVYRSKVAQGTLTDEERASPKCYPNNVTFSNYLDYLLVPSMVYQTDFARISTIRPWYCVQKVLHCFGALALGYTIAGQYVLPVMKNVAHISFIQAVMSLITPFLLLYLLVFWIIFECVCNFFAEITRFADRRFYDDWWNSQSWDEFARKWNRPVHHFLARHVYFHLINKHNLSNQGAMFTTFLFSAVLHELVMASMFRLFRPYLLAMMMLQIPLIQLGRLPAIRRHPRAGNIIFWFGMLVGPPLLAVSYAREYCVHLESLNAEC